MIWPFSRRRWTALLVEQHNEFMQALDKADAHMNGLMQHIAGLQERLDRMQQTVLTLSQSVSHGNIVAISANTAAGAAYEIAQAAQRYCVSVHEKAPRWEQTENLQALDEVLKRYETGVRVQ